MGGLLAVVIENPILNSPFQEPRRHWMFTDEGISNEIADGRRESAYFIPVPPPKKRGGQLMLASTEGWTAERMEPNDFVNDVRRYLEQFRRSRYPGVTHTTRELLEYWTQPGRERPLFFCQIEALETAIFLAEVAGHREPWIEARLRENNDRHNPGLYRIAFKMATGSGKTVVMAMLIAWQTLNKLASPQDKRFSDAFLVVTPGITIRDRLRVLLPNYPGNFYNERDIVTPDQLQQLQRTKILITNFHAFIRRDTFEAAPLTKKILAGPEGDLEEFKETPAEMVRRVCRGLGPKRGIVVINDEAHHCYQSFSQAEAASDAEASARPGKLTADERAEAEASQKQARVWLNGLRAIRDKLGVRAIYDLSATPFFLSGSGYREGTLFPWVVSDFSLIDSIEAGIVKIPRVPVADDAMTADSPTYRDLWIRIREDLPRKGRATDDLPPDRRELPKELEGALISLYGHYRRSFEAWDAGGAGTPPVFIVVCQNTNISKLVFDWIAGWEKTSMDGSRALVPGQLELFSNVEHGRWLDRPSTLLIDSAQLESGEAMASEFKRMAAAEIEEFKREFMTLNPGKGPEDITDEDLLREVMNTIGKKDQLGEQIRCVVSVAMLTEGWDANTVTHILGVRAFKTQLLCEQVVGRGLRRVSYEPDEHGMLEPEYAEVYGVPFQFLPTAGRAKGPVLAKEQFRVHALAERAALEQTFPRLLGYRYELPRRTLSARFGPESVKTLSTEQVPDRTELGPIVGESTATTLDELRAVRPQRVEFLLAKRVLDSYFRAADDAEQPWLFPQVLRIVREWLRSSLVLKDHTFPQLLLLAEHSHDAADRIYRSIVQGTDGGARVLPIVRPYEPIGSTADVDFTTTKKVYPTTKSHLNYLVEDSRWESKTGVVLEEMPEVVCYAKNQGLRLRIPYTFEGWPANYLPDLLIRVDDGGPEPLNLIVEVTGERKKEKEAKVATAQTLWVPAVNNHGGFGRWSFYEVRDPWNAESDIRGHIGSLARVAA